MVIMNEDTSLVPLLAGTLIAANLRFFALQATAASLGLIGVPEIQLNAAGVTVSVNQGTFTTGPWPALGSTGNPPVVNFVQSFGNSGYQVPTDTSGDSVALTFTAPLIGGSVQHFVIQISQFVYLTGSLSFAKSGQLAVPLTSGLIDSSTLSSLGFNSSTPGISATNANVNVMTIGASNVEAFVGVGGPYWNATNADGIPDRNPTTGQIVSSEINPNAVGLVIDNLPFGLFLGQPTLPGDPVRYVALKASASNIAFVGVPGLTATAQNINVEINMSSPTLEGLPVLPVIDFAALPGGGYQVPTGAVDGAGNPVTVNLDYSTPLIEASSSWIQLDLFGVLEVQGSIAFALGPQQTVNLANGAGTVTLSTMTVGATNVSGFVGYNGPYITDPAGDTNPNAHGLSLDNASLGLFIGFDTASPQVYLAAHLDIPAIHLVGMPSAITLAGTAQVDLDLGIGLLNGGTAIDFASSFPVTSTHPTQGFSVPTGGTPVVLDFTGFTVDVNVAGTLGLASTFSLAGLFSLQADASSLKIFAAGAMTIGPDIGNSSPLVRISALGVFILNSSGVAADVDVNASLGTSDLGLTVIARVIVNTTGANQTVEIPTRLLAVIQAYAGNASDPADATLASFLEGRLVNCADGTPQACYTVNGAAPAIFTTPNPTLTDVGILLGTQNGTLTYLSTPGPYLVVVMSGTFNFLGFASATGVGAIEISAGSFQLAASLNFTIGPISFGAIGFIGIQSDGVYAHIAISFNLNLLSMFDANLSGTLDINTQGSNDYFQLNLSGSLSVLSVISLNGSFQFIISNGAWSIPSMSVTASLGPLSLTASGDIYSSGKFDLHLHGEIDLGDCSGIGCVSGTGDIYASFDPGSGYFSFSVGGSLGATVEGVSLGSVSISGSASGTLGQSVTLYLNASGLGTFIEQVWGVVGSVTQEVCSWLPWPLDDACSDVTSLVYGWVSEAVNDVFKSFSIPIATFSLPGSLANVVAPPNLATQSGSVLTLNVGSRASNRNVSPTQTNETYEISSAGAGSVKITAFGTNQTFSGVSSITGNFGGGTDELILDPGMVMPVTVAGAGNTIVVGAGTNLSGLPGTGGSNSLVVVDGGPNPLTVNGVSSAGLYLDNLGTGTATLSSTQLTGFHTSGITYSGFGGLALYLTAGTDTLNVVSTAASEPATINAAHGSATINVGNAGVLSGIAGALVVNGAAAQNDVLSISDVSDTTGRTGTLTASTLTGLSGGSITYTNVIQLNLTLGSGHNALTVASTSGQTLTHIATAASSASGTVTIGNNLTQIQGPVNVNGGGADALVVSDTAASGNLSGSLSGTQLIGLGLGAQAQITMSAITALTISLGGSSNQFAISGTASGITTTLNAGVGGNTVVVQATGGPTVVNAGTGSGNTVAVGAIQFTSGPNPVPIAGSSLLTGLQGALTVNGHSADTLQVDGRGDTSARTGSLSSSLISGLGLAAGGIGYSGIGTLTLSLGSGNDTFAVTSTIGGSTTLAFIGGNDTVDLSSLNGAVTLNGGNGNDTVTIHSTNTGSTLTVNEGTGANWVALLAASGAVTINEGSGTDVVEIGSNAAATPRGVDTGGNVNAVLGAVTVNGGSGNDSLYLDETGDSSSTGNDGTLTASTISGLGLGAGIAYNAQELVSIALGAGSTEFAVEGTSTTTVVATGAGNDTVDVSSDGKLGLGTLGGLAAPLTIDGQGGSDTLNISDFADVVAGTGRLSSTSFTGFGTAGIGYAGFEFVNVQLGKAADSLDVVSTYLQAVTTIRAGPGGDTVNVSSDLGLLGGIAGHLVVVGQSGTGDVLNVSDAADAIGQTGALTSTDITGLGTAGITYSGLTALNITLGSGNDTFDVASTALGTTTTLDTGAGSDTVNVSSDAPANLGTLGGIAGHLVVNGQSGTGDVLNVSDAGDGVGQTGTLTSTDITGLGTAGIAYSGIELLNITLGSGNDLFYVVSTGAATTLATGPGNDTVIVGTASDVLSGLLSGIVDTLAIDGGGGSDSLTATDAADPVGQTGSLTSDFINGLTTAYGIGYTGFEFVTVDLGLGGDTFTVLSTITGISTVNGGPGNDSIDVETISGPTFINGGAGNDTLTVNGDTTNPSTTNGIGALLTLDGGAGSDAYLINTFGNGDSTIDVYDSGHDGGINTLTINGTAADDVFLFRAGLVASLTGFTNGAYTHAEWINYDNQITGGLTVNGLAGNDTFAFDDNSAVTTVNGGDGNDTFQVGQLFGAPEVFVTAVDLTPTTAGDLSNGISYQTTLNGDAGNDTFSIFHNMAPLYTNGGDGNDIFMVRTFVAIDQQTTVSTGSGSDLVQYVQNAPLVIDGGDGTDTVVVFGTAADDTFTITATGVSGSGIFVTMTNIEILRVDGLAGNDHFIVESTAPGVSTYLYGGLGSDTFDIGQNGDVSQIQGPLYVSGGDDPQSPPAYPAPILLPGESSSPLPILSDPNLSMIEANQIDTLNVNDGGVTAGQTGDLTSSTVTGLGMGSAGIVYAQIEAVNVTL
ncbi:MAG: calcium-binding protein, partial [Acidobacteriota bacterium]|nr:calcium-binding protein [Acidobacteriota bacterium]